jgi:anthranilate phosphoribosyltransferase
MTDTAFRCAPFIKEIGRGPNGARDLSRDDARRLYAAMLAGEVSDIELGAVLIAYRLKGESPVELAGMLDAAHATLRLLDAGGRPAVSIPSYNGARKQPNLVPLLAQLLVREGIAVLVHGVTEDPGRVTSAEILAASGIATACTPEAVQHSLTTQGLAFAPLAALSAPLDRLLGLRRLLGVRNSTHTLVKLLQPFATPGLRLVNYTHPAYRESLSALFDGHPELSRGGILLARGTEGEAVADTRRQVQIDWLHDGLTETVVPAARRSDDAPPHLPPTREADVTARWIEGVLAGRAPVPEAVAAQAQTIVRIVQEGRSAVAAPR